MKSTFREGIEKIERIEENNNLHKRILVETCCRLGSNSVSEMSMINTPLAAIEDFQGNQ